MFDCTKYGLIHQLISNAHDMYGHHFSFNMYINTLVYLHTIHMKKLLPGGEPSSSSLCNMIK